MATGFSNGISLCSESLSTDDGVWDGSQLLPVSTVFRGSPRVKDSMFSTEVSTIRWTASRVLKALSIRVKPHLAADATDGGQRAGKRRLADVLIDGFTKPAGRIDDVQPWLIFLKKRAETFQGRIVAKQRVVQIAHKKPLCF
jgi:hypothetical protein